MTYAQYETSLYSAQPNELYEFKRGPAVWRYTSSDHDVQYGQELYTALPIKRSALEQTQEMSRNPINIELDKNAAFVQQYRGAPPTDVVSLNVYRIHEGDTQRATIWIGRVNNVKFTERTAEVRCEPIFTSMKRPVLRRFYQSTCPHVLYGTQCKVLSANVRVIAHLVAVTGTQLTAPEFDAQPDGYFSGGFVEWEHDGLQDKRFITNHVGSVITLDLPIAGLPANATIQAYPGCDHLMSTCNEKFNNVDNYGGQPFYPQKNPMNGTPIF